jgi:predicted nucleic acid-binding protein
MPKIDLFLDSSALIAGIISGQGAARALLLLGEDEKIILTVSEQVIVEVERNIALKMPKILAYTREMILYTHVRILKDPSPEEVRKHLDWISHAADAPILVAAAGARVDFLVTLNTWHFIEDEQVSQRSGLRIGIPGNALAWVRQQLSQ